MVRDHADQGHDGGQPPAVRAAQAVLGPQATVEDLVRKFDQGANNFARVVALHPEIVRTYPSYKAARALKRLPALPLKSVLLNTSRIELWPADLLRARSNADARVLAPLILADALTPETAQAISRADSPGQGLAMLFASPAFLRR